jgi:hypothetical protein
LIFKILTFIFFWTITPSDWWMPIAIQILSFLTSNIYWGKHLVFI